MAVSPTPLLPDRDAFSVRTVLRVVVIVLTVILTVYAALSIGWECPNPCSKT